MKWTPSGGYKPYQPNAAAYPTYNKYRFGLENLNTYAGAMGADAMRETMVSRTVHYFCGELDTAWDGGFGEKNMPLLQGLNRFDCFLRYQAHVSYYYDLAWENNTTFVPVPGIDHDESGMMHAAEVLPSLFF